MELTSGFELTTAITNVLILVVAFILFLIVKKSSMWKFFFLLVSIDAFFGIIVHSIVMTPRINEIFWVILSIMLSISINTLLGIFIKLDIKRVFILSELLSVLMMVQMLYSMNYLLSFVIYGIIVLFIITYYILKTDNKIFYLSAFVIQLIGVILILCKLKISVINHNGICHLFTVVTLILLYLGSKKDIKI